MDKIKASDLAAWRRAQWEKQDGKCALSGLPVAYENCVVDHCHTTGQIRGVLDRGVNSMLGKIENHRKLAKLTDPQRLARMLGGVVRYINAHYDYPKAMYPTHRTPDEKRIRANAKARAKRAKAARVPTGV